MPGTANATSQLRFKVPKLAHSPLYKNCLLNMSGMTENKRALAVADEAAVDFEFEQQLRTRHSNDESAIRKYMQEAKSKASVSLWEKIQKENAMRFPGKGMRISDSTEGLELPKLGTTRYLNNGKEAWDAQTYEDFATKTHKENPGVSFNRESMDEAFRASALRMGSNFADIGDFNKMVKRTSTTLITSSALVLNRNDTGRRDRSRGIVRSLTCSVVAPRTVGKCYALSKYWSEKSQHSLVVDVHEAPASKIQGSSTQARSHGQPSIERFSMPNTKTSFVDELDAMIRGSGNTCKK
ncbi:hypothetical protein LTR37_009877 [Vermiconidia calcicola]|uniref:Uncharacterized protein n=1 Tax=Vermiconidia calcicola TaxID=1690605 RepID=A0ACC3N718_9PEZI|nr:hypothetical protein LTR37_009877 [Vermiconidia calcicola]